MFKRYLSGVNAAGLGASVVALSLAVSSGCVSRSAYIEDVSRLAAHLQAEKEAHAVTVRLYEAKLRDKSDNLTSITERYIALQKSNGEAQKKLNSLKGDLETLLRDMAELKMVIFHNVKGSEGTEMMIKLMEMQHRVKDLLLKETVEN
ncbi:MAG: hypothetical protein Q8P48_09735 [Deltaproteobacteria bacterium]|nr:hypothetical protein [Deltaproteobacteria bacterium]